MMTLYSPSRLGFIACSLFLRNIGITLWARSGAPDIPDRRRCPFCPIVVSLSHLGSSVVVVNVTTAAARQLQDLSTPLASPASWSISFEQGHPID